MVLAVLTLTIASTGSTRAINEISWCQMVGKAAGTLTKFTLTSAAVGIGFTGTVMAAKIMREIQREYKADQMICRLPCCSTKNI